MLEFDKILEDANRLSIKQWIQLTLLMIPAVLVATQMGGMVYLGADVEHRCAFPLEERLTKKCNRTWGEAQTLKFTKSEEDNKKGCYRYDVTEENSTILNCTYWWGNSSVAEMPGNQSLRSRTACTAWTFDNTATFKSTIVTEFNLLCSQSYKVHLAQAAFMLGVTLGCIFWGQIADRYGRVTTIVATVGLGSVLGISVYFVKTYIFFAILRALSGFCLFPAFTSSYVLATELVAPKLRVRVGQTEQSFFALGFCLLALYGFFIREWRLMQLLLSVPFLALLTFYWILVESPRWLIARMRHQEANASVEKLLSAAGRQTDEAQKLAQIANSNRDEKSDDIDITQKADTYGPVDLVRTRNIRRKSLVLFYCWLVCSCVYYGLTLNAADLGGDPFINLFLSGFVEIPASCLAILIMERWGRRPSLSFTLTLSGVACIAMLFVPQELLWLNITLSMTGKFSIAAAFGVSYIYSAELYPTPIRNVGIGTCSSCARIGGILSPLIAMLGDVAKPLPYVVFGTMAIIGGILALCLPEVLGIRLPETLREGELFGLDQVGPLQQLLQRLGCCAEQSVPDDRLGDVKYTAVKGDKQNKQVAI